MENKDFEFRYNMSLINFYKSHIDKLFFVSFITSMITLSVSFDVIHFIPLIIICYIDNIFLRFNSFGITSHSIKAFNFYTNFDKCELNNYIKIIKDAGFPIGTIGISRKAFSVDKCLISNCYGLYILKSSVPDEIYKKFCDNVSILAKKGYSSMVNIINKYTKKELLLNNN